MSHVEGPVQDEHALLELAAERQLNLASVDNLTIRRRRCGCGFVYCDERGKRVEEARTVARIKGLVIPPAYKDVRISRSARDHLQAIGRDEAGRLQYIYHPDWELVRETQKLERLSTLVDVLPGIRRRIGGVMRRRKVDREKAIAAVLMLIDHTHIRVGCDDYVHSGRSRGATTLLKRHVQRDGRTVRLCFHGKRRREISCQIDNSAFASVASTFLTFPGSRFFRYPDDDGRFHDVRAADVNAYLHDIARAPVSAKDFRTLAATAAAATCLGPQEPAHHMAGRRRQIATVIDHVADMLGNTPAVARRSYVHRCLIEAFEEDGLRDIYRRAKPAGGLSKGEQTVRMLLDRLARKSPHRG